jgi:diguanylate cyclase (GGDEF)-like protein
LLGRRCWYFSSCAFGIWALGQGLYLYYLRVPCTLNWPVRPDDLLWLLFGLPLLFGITVIPNEVDKVAWFDRMQATLFIVALYSLVFLSGGRLKVTQAYLIQNLALLLCCFLRFPACNMARERRFFVRLAVFLILYTALESLGDWLYSHGRLPGSIVDMVWTLPYSLYLILVLHDARHQDRIEARIGSFASAFRTMQGLSVAALTILSMALAAVLSRLHPLIGGVFVACTFLLFAIRTNLREKLWNEAHDRLQSAVLRDALTGLGNRLLLRKSLDEHLKRAATARIALLFVDLDRFKQINDGLGHELGDRVLIEVATRLSAAASSDSLVCRLGGDEFVVLSSAQNAAQAQSAGERLLRSLQTPILLGQQELRCTASIGVVLSRGGETADELLRTADHAMYRAKQIGRDRVQIFDASLQTKLIDRWQMEADLRACIAANSIQVAFQPIYSVAQQGLSGFEALARWSHPVFGSIPPAEFITLAESSGLIFSLGTQVLEKACAQMAAWNRAWGTRLSVSVNVSAHQFTDTALLPSLLDVLQRTQLPPALLRLEITETALLANQSVVREILERTRAHGIRISLDDFGTGYSSLSFLLSLPVDEIKVDRSFVSHMVQDANRKELVRTVIHLGHTLGKRVVAEGVETWEDLIALAEMGCECMQGFFISKPLSPGTIDADRSSLDFSTVSIHLADLPPRPDAPANAMPVQPSFPPHSHRPQFRCRQPLPASSLAADTATFVQG